MRALLLLVLACLVVPAHAQLYRHVAPDGSVTYTDRPPAPQEADSVSVDRAPSTRAEDAQRLRMQTMDAERQHQQRQQREQTYRERSRAEGAQLRQEQAEQKRIDDARRQGEVTPGMTADDARRLWGNPDRIKASNYQGQAQEQWVYRRNPRRFGTSNFDPNGADYVYVRDGVVTSVQARARIR
jgi:hypothetical protein